MHVVFSTIKPSSTEVFIEHENQYYDVKVHVDGNQLSIWDVGIANDEHDLEYIFAELAEDALKLSKESRRELRIQSIMQKVPKEVLICALTYVRLNFVVDKTWEGMLYG